MQRRLIDRIESLSIDIVSDVKVASLKLQILKKTSELGREEKVSILTKAIQKIKEAVSDNVDLF